MKFIKKVMSSKMMIPAAAVITNPGCGREIQLNI